MIFDIHVHTSEYSKCAISDAATVVAAARMRGLNGIVLTEHAILWPPEEIRILRDAFPDILVLRGVEISTSDDEDILVYGVTEIDGLTQRPTVADAMRIVRGAGGAAVLAHPLRYRDTVAEALLQQPPDACEGWSMNIYAFQRPGILDYCKRVGCPMLAASDTHGANSVGAYASRFNARIETEADLVMALRNGNFVPLQDQRRLAGHESGLTQRIDRVRNMIAEGLDTPAIRKHIGGSFSFIDHIRADRYPTLLEPDADPAGSDTGGLQAI